MNPKKRHLTKSNFERLYYNKTTGKLSWKDGPRKGKEAGWTDINGYLLTRIDGILIRNHHIVWFLETGDWPDNEIDHINRNPSDNRFSNLRKSDRYGQGANQTLQKRRVGKWKGVHNTCSGKYGVKLKYKGKQINGLGNMFTDPKEAALMYNYKAEEYFGPYAAFNTVFEDVDNFCFGD